MDKTILNGNKYFTWYWNICERAIDRILPEEIYCEKHHIYPISIYGQNKELVKLTAREHYIAHLLLWWGLRNKNNFNNIYTQKMCWAFVMMNTTRQKDRKINNSREFEYLRIALNERGVSDETKIKIGNAQRGKIVSEKTRKKLSESHKDQKPSEEMKKRLSEINSGVNHPQYGTKHSDETIAKMSKPRSEEGKKNISESHKGQVPWNKGLKDCQVPWNKGIGKIVYQYDLQNNFIQEFKSVKEAFEVTKISNIGSCCLGKRDSCKGFKFSYVKFLNI